MTDYCLCLADQEHEAEEVDKELQHHRRDGIEVKDIWQGTFFREASQWLK